jgi:hypothetical protein
MALRLARFGFHLWRRAVRLWRKRQPDAEDCAPGGVVIAATDIAAAAIDNVFGQPKAQSGSGGSFGSKEGLKEPVPDGGRDAFASVSNGDAHPLACISRMFGGLRPYAECAAVVHGVDRVGDQVHQNLP